MYAVTLMSFFDNELKMTIIDSNSIENAMLDGTKKILKGDTEWVEAYRNQTEEEIKQSYFDMDMVICSIKI